VTIIAVTRLRLRSFRFLLRLNWESSKIERVLVDSPGFLGGKVLADRNRAYWTMTRWQDLDAMFSFRNSRAHAAAGKMLDKWCDEASVVHWETEEDQLPSWNEAHRRMTEGGRLSRIALPSADHKARRFREPYWAKWREKSLHPAKSSASIAA
jgi:heme-degrading monooxygenase HmoA